MGMKRASLFLAALPLAFGCATKVLPFEGGGGGTSSSGGDGGAGGGPSGQAATSVSVGTGTGGAPTACVYAEDCIALDGACGTGACVNGFCQSLPANEGGACDDGLYCTENDKCQTGTCIGGGTK